MNPTAKLPVHRRKVRGRHAGRSCAECPPDVPAPRTGLEQAVAALESEAVRRALSGVEIPVFHQGRECGNTVKHSDQLLMFLLKTLCPERYAGMKEPAPRPHNQPVILDIDLSAAAGGHDEVCGEANGEDGGEDNEPGYDADHASA